MTKIDSELISGNVFIRRKGMDGSQSIAVNLPSILSKPNLTRAYRQVVRNRGASGVDNMPVSQLGDYLRDNWGDLKSSLYQGDYQPNPLRRVEIPNPSGGIRELGIPTVLDRFLQQSIAQILSNHYETKFSEFSYGFRPGRSCHQALDQSLVYLQSGYEYVVVIDLKEFFNKVNHDQLMYGLSQEIIDKSLLKLIRKYLTSGVMVGGVKQATEMGTPQGGNLSPVLSNIVLDRLDKELESRGHHFVRYADDISIFVKSERAGQRVLQGVTNWIENRLKLQVNEAKSGVYKYNKVNLLGYGYYKDQNGIQLRVSPKSYRQFREKLRKLTKRSFTLNHRLRVGKINQVTRGWLQYFSKAKGKNRIKSLDEWLRRRLRQCLWVQWKRIRTRIKNLQKMKVPPQKAYEWANTRKGSWCISKSPILHSTITNKRLERSGYKSLLKTYNHLHENLSNRRDT